MEYKGFKITREEVGRYGTRYRYRCGNIIAPRKKDVVREIDKILDDKIIIDLKISHLDKYE